MKIIVIGDIHGQDIWKTIIEKEKTFDKVIFLGDYFDSFDITPNSQLENYKEISKFRDNNKNKVITLLGNHEYHYITTTSKYSGWKNITNVIAHDIILKDFNDNNKLKYVYKHNNILFSHAGISNYWLYEVAETTLENLLENQVHLKHFDINFFLNFDRYGNSKSNGPLWIRPASLIDDTILGYKQVVGHTHMKQITNIDDTLYFCDTLPYQYLVIENNQFIIKNIN